ncbi:MAG: hypothetical protein EOO20_03845 [Chryseobacterium sp.]|nr:MAG: hypothetical protein EOO20_03845 [Chryseobacterium sp.]
MGLTNELRAKIRYAIATSIHAAIQKGFMGYDEAADKVLKIALEHSNSKLDEAAEAADIEEIPSRFPYGISDWKVDKESILSLKDKI